MSRKNNKSIRRRYVEHLKNEETKQAQKKKKKKENK